MRTLTHKAALVIIPPHDAWPPIQDIRREHDRKVKRWMPHITLIYPFLPKGEFDAVRDPLIEACQQVDLLDIALTEFRKFRHRRDNFTIWLDPRPEDPIVDLHTALSEALAHVMEPAWSRPFRPHLSVGQARGKHRSDKLIRELQRGWQAISFGVDEISLIWRHDPPDDQFQVASTIALKPP